VEAPAAAATQADSSATVFVIGAAAVVALLVAVLIPTLCRRKCRALFGAKNANNRPTNVSKTSDVPEAPVAAPSNHDWDVDASQDRA
jgi:hypothetical protein